MPKPARSTLAKLKINILYPQGLPQKLPVKFLKWLISYGRYIVIVVEGIVLAVFFLRFKYDADLDFLKQQINAKIPIIQAQSADEALIDQTHQKLDLIKTTINSDPNWQVILSEIASQTPTNSTIQSISLTPIANSQELNFKITAQTANNSDINVFLDGLGNDSAFQSISLASISFDQGVISYSIDGGTK